MATHLILISTIAILFVVWLVMATRQRSKGYLSRATRVIIAAFIFSFLLLTILQRPLYAEVAAAMSLIAACSVAVDVLKRRPMSSA